ECAEFGSAYLGCIREYGLEDRFALAGRRADDLEHVGGRRLLLQRLAQLAQQPRILDGDDGLGSEILDQLNLLLGKRQDLLTIDIDRADHRVVLEHGNENDRASTTLIRHRDDSRIAFAVGLALANILDVHNALRPENLGMAALRV